MTEPDSGSRVLEFKKATPDKLPLPEPPKQLDYFDTKVRGFGLRVGYGGRRTWFVMYRYQGRKRRFTIGRYRQSLGGDIILGLGAARDRAREILQMVELDQDPQAKRQKDRRAMTFAELAEAYMERYAKPRKATWKDDQRKINRDLLPELGPKKASAVTRADIRAVLDKMVNRGAPVGANKTLEVVRRIYSWAVDQELVTDNPVTGVKKVAPAGERNRFLTSDELARYWRQLEARTEDSPIAASILKIMLLTGQRRGEVARMQWGDLDLQDGWWNAPAERTKTRRPYRIPITPGVQRAIDTMRGRDDTWVFVGKSDEGNVGSNVVTQLSRQICAKEKIKDFVPHDCRHTVATHLASMGIAEEVIARVLHHSAAHAQTAKYNEHRYDAEKRRTVEAWEAKIDEMLGRQGKSNVVAMGA